MATAAVMAAEVVVVTAADTAAVATLLRQAHLAGTVAEAPDLVVSPLCLLARPLAQIHSELHFRRTFLYRGFD